MSKLLIEIGNTALKAAWAEGMTLGRTYRYQGEKPMEFITEITAREKPSVMVISSQYDISPADEKRLMGECGTLVVLDSNHTSILEHYGLPSFLSFDRAANILAARYLFKGKGCILFDLGTTMTVDFLSADGEYEGGNISLGCRTRFKALNRYSKALPLINNPSQTVPLGMSLRSSMESGVVSGIMFEIEGYAASRPDSLVVFTGGDANYFAKWMKSSIFVVCNLVLIGLALIAEGYEEKVD